MNNAVEIEFNEEEHKYIVNGEEFISVTTLMSIVTSDMYANIPAYILENKAKLGNRVHQLIEIMEKFDIEPAVEDDISGYIDGYRAFKKKYEPKYTNLEKRVLNLKSKYAGTLDAMAYINLSNDLVMIDFKTTLKVHKKYIILQLSGYLTALLDMRKRDSSIEIPKRFAVLNLQKNGDYKFIIFTKEEIQDGLMKWKALTEVQRIKEWFTNKT